ncbi:MAG: hypothetical protein KM296_08165 [Brockia lithotrophica]|nr:hypothetical protein [Brockia lithotrophica]MBT9253639.1 hypothetical protein [Brockia lithotrophica]
MTSSARVFRKVGAAALAFLLLAVGVFGFLFLGGSREVRNAAEERDRVKREVDVYASKIRQAEKEKPSQADPLAAAYLPSRSDRWSIMREVELLAKASQVTIVDLGVVEEDTFDKGMLPEKLQNIPLKRLRWQGTFEGTYASLSAFFAALSAAPPLATPLRLDGENTHAPWFGGDSPLKVRYEWATWIWDLNVGGQGQ